MTSQEQTTTEEETYVLSLPKPRKVLFLDIDDVLNNSKTKTRCGTWLGVDPKLTRRFVDWWRKNPDVGIVLSSTWRKDSSMWSHLNAAGIYWFDVTENSMGRYSREEEIMLWLDNNDVDTYVVLDDIPMKTLRAVRTDGRLGLTEEHTKRLTELFS